MSGKSWWSTTPAASSATDCSPASTVTTTGSSYAQGAVGRSDPRLLQALEDLPCQAGGLRGGLAHLDTRRLQGILIGVGGARRARQDGAGVAHRLALGSCEARNVADDRLGDVGLDVLGGAFLGVAADLADHHDDLGFGVLLERLDGVDMGGADDRVPADADGRREAEIAQLEHHLGGERAGLGHQPDRAGPADVGRAGAHQPRARSKYAWALLAE